MEASRLAASHKIATRVAALREAAWKQESLSRESVLFDVVQAASEAGDTRTAIRGLEVPPSRS